MGQETEREAEVQRGRLGVGGVVQRAGRGAKGQTKRSRSGEEWQAKGLRVPRDSTLR